ncbi:hypothetical protein IFU26_21395 [Pantoea agglomerans]|nr:hypothetical protein [Pantoea agglomerans]
MANSDLFNKANIKKKNIKTGNDEEKRPANLKMASQRISNLELKNKVLAEELRSLEERFVVWQFNAINHGISFEQLNNGLPKIDRETNAD